MPDKLRERLAKNGVLDARRVAASKPLQLHVDGETDSAGHVVTPGYKQYLSGKGNTVQHVNLTIARIKRVIDGCGFRSWSDLSAARVQSYLASLRDAEKSISAASFNYYLQAMKSFCRWMVRDRRACENPLGHLQGQNIKTDKRHARRA